MVPLTTPQVWVDGRPLSSLASWGDLKITHRWPYGCWALDWGMALKPYQRPIGLKADVPVEARMGSAVIWSGVLVRPDWDAGTFEADGLARQGEETLCLTSDGETTSTPDTAIDAAIARGAVDWIRRSSLSSAAFADGGSTADLNYVTALLDAWSSAQGKRWGVNARREVYAVADPTTPSIYIRPGTGVLGVAAEAIAGTVVGAYYDADHVPHRVSVGSGRPEVGVGLANRGALDSTSATAIITGIRDQLQAVTGWTNGITVTADQVTAPGGEGMALDRVVAGEMSRLLGLRDERGASAQTDIVLGETIWDVTAGTVQCNPVGLSDRSLSGVIEAAGGELL
jgi:hypothetical protein